jgi:enoyl-CoA hydratase/carnithine racemase
MNSGETLILADVRNRIGHLTLNRPSGLNTLTLPMVRLLQQHLQAWEQDDQVLAVVLRGNGEKAFCAGGDIRMLYDSHTSGSKQHEVFLAEEYALDQYLHAYPKPVLALLDGFVLGGGMGLAQAATLRVVSERVKMGMPEVSIGFFPDVGGSYFLPRLPGQLGFYLGLTGLHVGAADALFAGLADHCLSSERLTEFDQTLDNLSWSAPALESLQQVLDSMTCSELPAGKLNVLRQAIDDHFALPDLAAIRSALMSENHPELQAWAQDTVKVLDSRSPLAMAVTLELLQRGQHLTLADCFAQELHLDYQWFEHGDLIEGIRALIIDKDKTPHWNPATLAELDPQRVLAFFNGFHPAASNTLRNA